MTAAKASWKSRDVVVPAALAALCLLVFFVFVLPPTLVDDGQGIVSSYDLSSYFLPRFTLGSDELLHGRLPLWNEYEYGGIPLLATAQPAALYPPKVALFCLFRPGAALVAFLAFNYVFAAGALVAFLREEGIRGVGIFAGVATWIFAAPLLGSNYNPVRISCLAWMPVVFLLSTRVVRGGGLRAFAPLAASVALLLFAGYPEEALDLGPLVALHAAVLWATDRRLLPPWKSVPLLAAAFVLGAIAASPQLLPLAELAGVANRAGRARVTTLPYLEPASSLGSALNALVPALPLLHRKFEPIAAAPLLLVFAMIGMVQRRARSALVGYGFCMLMMFGGWRLLHLLPGFQMVRFSLTWFAQVPFYVAWGAAAGAARITDGRAPRSASRSASLVFLTAWAALVFVSASVAASARARGATDTLLAYLRDSYGGPAAVALTLAGAAGLAVLSLARIGERRVPGWTWYAALATGTLAYVAAYPQGRPCAPFAPPPDSRALASFLGGREPPAGRAFSPRDLLYGHEIFDRVPSSVGVENSFLPLRWVEITERLRLFPSLGLADPERFLAASGFFSAMNTQYILAPTFRRREFAARGIVPVAERKGETLYENPFRLGHAWVNHATYHAGSPGEALERVLRGDFDPRREAVVEDPSLALPPDDQSTGVTIPSAGVRRSPTEIDVDVELTRPGILVVSESNYPGWVAVVDGVERPCSTADYVLKAVRLEAGRHHVTFAYRSRAVRWGLGLGAAGWLLVLGLLVAGMRQRPRLLGEVS